MRDEECAGSKPPGSTKTHFGRDAACRVSARQRETEPAGDQIALKKEGRMRMPLMNQLG